jgi:hypothetical protein
VKINWKLVGELGVVACGVLAILLLVVAAIQAADKHYDHAAYLMGLAIWMHLMFIENRNGPR